jgi:hypothetical protein
MMQLTLAEHNRERHDIYWIVAGRVMKAVRNAVLLIALVLLPTAAVGEPARAPKNAYLYIVSPKDGATVIGGFWCVFGLRYMGVTHAGNSFARSGHHHLLIDVDPPVDPNVPIPQDKQHIHYGGGQTEGFIQLPPGKHTLQLILGDGDHLPFVIGDSAGLPSESLLVSKKITITVKESVKRSDKMARQASGPRSKSNLEPTRINGPKSDIVIERSRNSPQREGETGE